MAPSPLIVVEDPLQTALNITHAIQEALSQISDTTDRCGLSEAFSSYFPGLDIPVHSERKEDHTDSVSELIHDENGDLSLVELETRQRELFSRIEQLRSDLLHTGQEKQMLASQLNGLDNENSPSYVALLNRYISERNSMENQLDQEYRALRANDKLVWKKAEAESRQAQNRLKLQVREKEQQLANLQRERDQEKQRLQDDIRARHEQEMERESEEESKVIDQRYSPLEVEAEQNVLDLQTDLEQKHEEMEQEKTARAELEQQRQREHQNKLAQIQQENEEKAKECIVQDRKRVEQELKTKDDESKRKEDMIIHLDGERKRTYQEIEEGKIRQANSQVWRLWNQNRVWFIGGGTAENKAIIRERIQELERCWSECQRQSDPEQAVKTAMAKGGALSKSITSAFVDSETLNSVDRWVGQASILYFMDKNLKKGRSFATFCEEWKHLPFFRKRDEKKYGQLVRLGELATKYSQVWCWTMPVAHYYKHTVAIKRLLDVVKASDTVEQFREQLVLLDQDRYSDHDFKQMRSLWSGDKDWIGEGADEWMTEEQQRKKRQKRDRNHISLGEALGWIEVGM
jgi:hypothetical protein